MGQLSSSHGPNTRSGPLQKEVDTCHSACFSDPQRKLFRVLLVLKTALFIPSAFGFEDDIEGCTASVDITYFISFFFSLPFSLEETNAFSVYLEIERLHWDMFETVFVATCT